MKYVLVLDVTKGKIMFMLSSNAGEILIEPIEYLHNKQNFELTALNFIKEFPHDYIIQNKIIELAKQTKILIILYLYLALVNYLHL